MPSTVPRRHPRGHGRTVALTALGLLLPAMALAAVAWTANSRASGAQEPPPAGVAPSGPRPVTPVLSVRRAPEPLAERARAANFAIAMSPVTDAVQDRACVATAVDGTPLVTDNAAAPFVPASNMKLVTAAVALDVLGPDYQFVTEVHGTVRDGTVPRLVLVGSGDPLLSTAEYPGSGINTYPPFNTTSLETLADAVVARGVTRVTNLIADESRYDEVREAPGWGDLVEEGEVAYLSALMVDDGYVDLERRVRRDSTAAGALEVFRGMLERRGVTVDLAAVGVSEGEPVLTSVSSVPLSQMVAELLTNSDNDTAELLLKEVGRAATGVGSTAAGASVAAERLASWGVSTDGFVMVDGSGLSADNRVTCTTFMQLLGHVGAEGPVFDGLPVAGQTGTLEQYFEATPAEGVLRAKTGSLSIARSLSGFFPTADGSAIAFSFLVNGEGAKSRAERLWDDLARAFASYPQGPSPEQLAPAPAASE